MSNIFKFLEKMHFTDLHLNSYFIKFISMFSILVLISALVIDYVMQFMPCILCIYERIPYGLLGILYFISFFPNKIIDKLNKQYIIYFVFLCLLSSIMISGFHVGVEREIISATEKCDPSIRVLSNNSLADYENMLNSSMAGNCKNAPMRIIGLSLAECNLCISCGLMLLFFLVRSYEKTKFSNISR